MLCSGVLKKTFFFFYRLWFFNKQKERMKHVCISEVVWALKKWLFNQKQKESRACLGCRFRCVQLSRSWDIQWASSCSAGVRILKVCVVHSAGQDRPPIEAALIRWPFPTTSRHLGGSHPCITVLLNQRLNVQVVPEVGCCECGIS